jgi:tetratricopeptide (TPR) repeat protein
VPDACPRCQHAPAAGPSCAKCGVVFARLRAPGTRRAAPSVPVEERGPGSTWVWVLLVVVVGALAAAMALRRPARTAAAALDGLAPLDPAPQAPALADPGDAPPPPLVALAPPSAPPVSLEAGAGEADRAEITRLEGLLLRRAALTEGDLEAGAGLAGRYPQEAGPRKLAAALFIGAAFQDQQARRFERADARLRRAAALDPASPQPLLALVEVAFATGDWQGAEASARAALALDPRGVDALRALAFALFRQDRNREAQDVLRDALSLAPGDAASQMLLARIQKGLADERGMTEQNLAHFHVRYDGGEHAAVGREILRALERHYATLASTLGHQPAQPIAVILFTQQGYYDASGAPAWSGGVFDNIDGRIRIPVGGLDASLTPDMDGTLVHELTHAFVADITRGVCPREIHEGLAQYMEGHRIESKFNREQLKWIAEGRAGGVGGFYASALALAEYLVAQRGMGGVTELLREMGATGSVDEAVRNVYGMPYADLQRRWAQRMRQQYGS